MLVQQQEKNGRPFKAIWSILSPYWWSEERLIALGLLGVIVALNLGLVYLTVLFNEWNRYFYNALQELDYNQFKWQLLRFLILALAYIAGSVYRLYLTQMLEMRWRRWLTDRYMGRWLENKVYYRMGLEGGATDNPDQRIAEDFRFLTSGALTLSLGLLSAIVTVISFLAILWALSGPLDFELSGVQFHIQGYLLWFAILYAGTGSWLAHKIGRPLIGLNFQQQRLEADFRFGLVRVREHAEGIALYGGESLELESLNGKFGRILRNWWSIMRTRKSLMWFTSSYRQIAIIFPFVAAAPRYFKGGINLGSLMQIVSAFDNIESNLSWFVDNYPLFAEWKASADRLTSFDAQVSYWMEHIPPVQRDEETGADLDIESLFLNLPSGGVLQDNINEHLQYGERLLVKGPTGSGKSTLFRTIAGIWPFASGKLVVPSRLESLFLPQRPYIPIVPLRYVLNYPGRREYPDEALQSALAECGLSHLVSRLDETAHWEQTLSIGEQQRLAFARVLLQKPKWIFLDEATSAVDDSAQKLLYEALLRNLPKSSVLSIAHREGVEKFHGRVLELR